MGIDSPAGRARGRSWAAVVIVLVVAAQFGWWSASTAVAAAAPAPTPPLAVRGADSAAWLMDAGAFRTLGGTLIAPPVTAEVDGPSGIYTLYIGTGTDHDIWASAGDGGWKRMSPSPVNCLQGPAAVVVAQVLYVGCEGGDAALWEASAPFAAGTIPVLSNWAGHGGALMAGPAAFDDGGRADFIVTGMDSRLWELTAAVGFRPIQIHCYGHPDAAPGPTFNLVGCRGLDNQAYYATETNGTWTEAQPAGGNIIDMLAARGTAAAVLVDAAAPDGSVWETPISATGPGPWHVVGGRVAATVETPYVNSGIPLYDQTMPLDCEAAAEQMALAYSGHGYSQTELFNAQNPDTRRAYRDSGGTLHWGDPYTNFVGNVYGSEGNYTGYGVYYPPIVSIAHSHGMPNATGGEGYRPVDIYNAVAVGHPVEAWVEYHWARPALGSWVAWDGRRIVYTTWEHAVVITGVSDTGVRVNDPVAGSPYWISRSTFETSWRDFGNMAVVFA